MKHEYGSLLLYATNSRVVACALLMCDGVEVLADAGIVLLLMLIVAHVQLAFVYPLSLLVVHEVRLFRAWRLCMFVGLESKNLCGVARNYFL